MRLSRSGRSFVSLVSYSVESGKLMKRKGKLIAAPLGKVSVPMGMKPPISPGPTAESDRRSGDTPRAGVLIVNADESPAASMGQSRGGLCCRIAVSAIPAVVDEIHA